MKLETVMNQTDCINLPHERDGEEEEEDQEGEKEEEDQKEEEEEE